ncbi:glutamate racemase [Azotosporobacter soli]|uniref:glutamate racemase n=1 Tax=Azotosporobacter soli TaxID=3055040 RepID=UPI0031FEE3FF
MKVNLPIGIFDSGIGGLTVYEKLRQRMPKEDIIYFGDTGRAPYGARPEAEIRLFVDGIMRLMSLFGIKLGVVACNTITVLGTEKMSERYNFDLVGNSSGTLAALSASRTKRIGVLATENTIANGMHKREILRHNPEAKVFCQACPSLAPLVEAGDLSGIRLRHDLRRYLLPLRKAKVDTVILGCTHYPYLTPLIQEMLGAEVTLIDPADETASRVEAYLQQNKLVNEDGHGESSFYFSAKAEQAKIIAQQLFDARMATFAQIELAELESFCRQPVLRKVLAQHFDATQSRELLQQVE